MTIQVSTSTAFTSRDTYLAELLSHIAQLPQYPPYYEDYLREDSAWTQRMRDLRASAVTQARELVIPTARDEEWRFTDLSPLLNYTYRINDSEKSSVSLSELQSLILKEAENYQVFQNGHKGIVTFPESSFCFGGLDVLLDNEDFFERLQSYPGKLEAKDLFAALNTAGLRDAAVLIVPKDVVVETPIHLLFVAAGELPTLSLPRCFVLAEAGSQVTIVEEFIGFREDVYFTNAVTQIWVEEDAQVNHTRVQRDSKESFHIGKTVVSQARDSRYICNAVSLGAKLSRHNLEVYHTGEQTETTLNGLTMISGEQVADTHSTIAYAYPHGSSNQIHKCIVDDRAHAVFNGKVYVPKAAQLTDAKQLSSTLLLSPKARIDTKPQLEITADNVKCTHGATVSQLDSDEVFYLQSRGIDEDSARKLLTYAFAYEVIQEIPVASLREKLAAIVREQQVTSQKG